MRLMQAFTFEAAHRLPMVPDGHRCKRMHGHSYRVEIFVEAPVDAATGMAMDFFDIEEAMAPLLAQLDHAVLNDVPGLENPTAENIATWIAKRALLPRLSAVRVWETPYCYAELDVAAS